MVRRHYRKAINLNKNLPWIIVFVAVAIVIVGVFGPTGLFTGVAQEAVYVVGNDGLILKSSDGGETWETQDSETTESLLSTYFLDIDTGFATGYSGTLLKTTDGGDNWNQVSRDCTPTDNCHINDIHFANDQTGYAASYDTFLKTTDGGDSWEAKDNIPFAGNRKNSVFFVDEETGYLAGDNRVIEKTENGWDFEDNIPSGNSDWNDIYFTDENTGYIVSSYGQIRKTTTAGEGENWWEVWETLLDIDGHFKSIHFTDENTGYVTGVKTVWHGSQGGPFHTTGVILKTTDAGETWEELDLSIAEIEDRNGYNIVPTLYSIHFANSNRGYAVGGYGTILKTEDAGETWEVSRPLETPQELKAVFSIIEIVGDEEEESETGVSEIEGAARAFVPITTERGIESTTDSYYDEDGSIPVKEGDFVILSPNVEVVGDTLPSWIDRDEGTYTEPTVVKWFDGERRLRSISLNPRSIKTSPLFWKENDDTNSPPYVFDSAEAKGIKIKYLIGEFDMDYCLDSSRASETELSCTRPIDENDFPPGSIIRTFGIPGGQDSAEYTLTMEATKPDGSTVLDYITVNVRKTSYEDENEITVVLAEPKGKTAKTETQILEEYEEATEAFWLEVFADRENVEEMVSEIVEREMKGVELNAPSLNSDAYEYMHSVFSRVNNFYEEASNGKVRFDFYVLEKTLGERYELNYEDDYYCDFSVTVDLLPVIHTNAKSLVEVNGGKIRGDIMTIPYIDCFTKFDGKYMPLSGNILISESEADILTTAAVEVTGTPAARFSTLLHELGHWLGSTERYDGKWYQVFALFQESIPQYSTMGTQPGSIFTNTFDSPTLMAASKMEDWIEVTDLSAIWAYPSGTYTLRPLLHGEAIHILTWVGESALTIEYRTNHPLVSVWERNIEPAVVVTFWNKLFDDTSIVALLTEEGDSFTFIDMKITLDEIRDALAPGYSTKIKIESQSEGNGAILEMKEITYKGEDATKGYDEIDRHLGVYPNLDLHATVTYNNNEYHVGIDYEEKVFDCPSFAQCSGDSFSTEWIFLPASAEAEYYITDHDTGELNLESPVDIGYTIQYFELDEEERSMTQEYEGTVTNNVGKFTSKHYTTPQATEFVVANDKVNSVPMNQDWFKNLGSELDILSRTEVYDIGDTIIVDVQSIFEDPNAPAFDAPGGVGGGTGGIGSGVSVS